jgi:hypothetical protein
VEILERIANPEEPPLRLSEIDRMRSEITSNPSKEAEYTEQLNKMETAFRGRGEPGVWRNEILNGIDSIFVTCYTDEETQQISESLFFPNSSDNQTRFRRYYVQVDQFLRERPDHVPMYCREYFAYYTLWRKMGYDFPMPLGTASVIMALHNIADRYKLGLCEVSTKDGWMPRIGYILCAVS